ncbi:hypothetical protein, partial [Reyranella sp.]|uniref:hypothetical protein n=1 Tax=Reyranella sp. TaxID=1929291 RepID=UPI0025EA1D57
AVHVSHEAFGPRDLGRVVERVNGLLSAEGWLRLQSDVLATPALAGAFEKGGAPVAGEWAVSPSESVLLRQMPDGWTFWTYREVLAAGGDARAVLAQDCESLARDGRVLCYRVYWGTRDTDPAGVCRLFQRFVGYGRKVS